MTTINLEPFDIKFVQKSDHQQILELLRRFFYRDEPLNTYLKLLEGKESCPCLDKYCLKSLNDDNSFMAVTKSGKLIGVSVNKIKRRGVTEEMDKIENPKFLKIATLLGYIDNESDIFGKYADIDTQLSVDILSVDPTYRGYGIAKQLMDKTREHAKKQGVQLMRVDCTSHFSARATAKLGFECVYNIKYEDYKVDGKPVFEPELPHTEVKIYVQRIDGKPLSKI